MAAKSRSRRSIAKESPSSKSKRRASDVVADVLEVCTQAANANPSETDKYRSTMAEVMMCAAHEPQVPVATTAQQTSGSQLPPPYPPACYSDVYNLLSSLVEGKEPPVLSDESLTLVTKMYDNLLAKVKTAVPSLPKQVELLKKTRCKQRGNKAGPPGKRKGRQQKGQCPSKNVFLNDESINPLHVPGDLVNF